MSAPLHPKSPSDGYCRAAWMAVCRSQAVIEMAVDGRITWVNGHFLNLVDYPLEAIIGRHHRMLCFHDYAASEEYQAFWRILASGEYSQGEYRRCWRDGSELWLQASYNPLLDQEGSVQRVLKVATDITRQVVLERQAAEIRAALQERGPSWNGRSPA